MRENRLTITVVWGKRPPGRGWCSWWKWQESSQAGRGTRRHVPALGSALPLLAPVSSQVSELGVFYFFLKWESYQTVIYLSRCCLSWGFKILYLATALSTLPAQPASPNLPAIPADLHGRDNTSHFRNQGGQGGHGVDPVRSDELCHSGWFSPGQLIDISMPLIDISTILYKNCQITIIICL